MKSNKRKSPLDIVKSPKTTGQLIKAFRVNFEISQMDLASICRVTQANLSSIENDKREIGADIALRMSAALGVAPEIILYPNGYESQPQFIETKRRAMVLRKHG
jgi:transcriptional regulator with XRE-family HTH domain